jgi:hypothetical protein
MAARGMPRIRFQAEYRLAVILLAHEVPLSQAENFSALNGSLHDCLGQATNHGMCESFFNELLLCFLSKRRQFLLVSEELGDGAAVWHVTTKYTKQTAKQPPDKR